MKEVFEFSKSNKEIPSYLVKYFDNICNNGLENVFFFSEKASFWKIGLMILTGIGLLALSLTGFGFLGLGSLGIVGKIMKEIISSIVGRLRDSFIYNGIDDLIKGEHDRFFRDSYDIGLFEFLK